MGVRARSFDFSIFFLFFMLFQFQAGRRRGSWLLLLWDCGEWGTGDWGWLELEQSLRYLYGTSIIHQPSAISSTGRAQGPLGLG